MNNVMITDSCVTGHSMILGPVSRSGTNTGHEYSI